MGKQAWLPLCPNNRFNDGLKMLPRGRMEIHNTEAAEDSMRSIAEAEKQYVPPVSQSQKQPAPLTPTDTVKVPAGQEIVALLVCKPDMVYVGVFLSPGARDRLDSN